MCGTGDARYRTRAFYDVQESLARVVVEPETFHFFTNLEILCGYQVYRLQKNGGGSHTFQPTLQRPTADFYPELALPCTN